MKFAGAIMLVTSSVAMGYLASHKLSRRVCFLEQFLQFISYVETEIRYSSALIIEIIGSYKAENEFAQLMEEFFKILKHSEDINISWETAVKNTYINLGLKKREAEIVTNFINELGTNDTEGQMNHCRLNSDLITNCLQTAREEKQKKSKVYFMAYMSAGVCIALSLT